MNNNIKDKLKKRFKNQFDEFIKTDLNDYELTKKSYDYLYPNQEALFISSYMYYSKYSVLDEGVGLLHLNAINREKDIDEKTFNYCFRQITISILVLVIESNKRMHKERSVYKAENGVLSKKVVQLTAENKVYEKALDKKNSEERNKDRELENAHNIIKTLRSRKTNKVDNENIRTLIDDYRQSKLPSDKIDAVKKYLSANCKLALKKNGLINFRKLGGLLDCHHQTARSWCDLFNIKSKTL